jgi:hypothetical protein
MRLSKFYSFYVVVKQEFFSSKQLGENWSKSSFLKVTKGDPFLGSRFRFEFLIILRQELLTKPSKTVLPDNNTQLTPPPPQRELKLRKQKTWKSLGSL